MRAPISIIFLLLSFTGLTQVNLVPNGSFEEYTDCPDGTSASGMLHGAEGWYHPTMGTADLFHECANPDFYGVPTNTGVDAQEGSAMAHLVVHVPNTNPREYAGVKLDTALEAGKHYKFSMWLRALTDWQIVIGSFGAFFSVDSATDYSNDHWLYPLVPQLQRNPDSIMLDPYIWYEWVDTLEATGGEQYLLLGNFLDHTETPYVMLGNSNGSTYLIDNISLILIEDTLSSAQEMELPKLQLTNNVVRDELRFSVSGNSQPESISLINLNGALLEHRPYNGDYSIDVSHFPAGMYVINATAKNGLVAREKFVKL